MRYKTLNIYLNGVLVGKLVQGQYGRLSFTYAPEFLNQATTGISLSLPLQEKPFEDGVVKAFFSGLLPDEKIRQRLAAYLGLSEQNPFALLEAIGGECAGALSLYPEEQRPPSHTGFVREGVVILHNADKYLNMNSVIRHSQTR